MAGLITPASLKASLRETMTAEPGTRVLSTDGKAIDAAARCLSNGGLVAFPTETVYGLGADAGNGEAIARLYAAKGRPAFNPLIAHVAGADAARTAGVFTGAAEKLATAFWPGPLTLVLAKQPDCRIADLALAGLDTIAVRVPAHPVAHALLAAFGGPIVAPSANRSGHVSPTSAAHVLTDLRGRIDLIVDAGPCKVGVESTIISCAGEPTLLRPGGLPREAIERLLGRPLTISSTDEEAPPAPGMLASHYAPKASLRLDADGAQPGEVAIAWLIAQPGVTAPIASASSAVTATTMPIPVQGRSGRSTAKVRRAAA